MEQLQIQMPSQISYTLLVHAGSYKDFLAKVKKNFPDMEITYTKQKAVHYYIICITENGKTEYKKKDIYGLPIMGMREEFSNYLFFKSTKAYNNVLKLMCNGKENKEAPYTLFQEMLTPFEKYNFANIKKDTKILQYEKLNNSKDVVSTTVYGDGIFNEDTKEVVFDLEKCKVDGEAYSFVEVVKKQDLRIGII